MLQTDIFPQASETYIVSNDIQHSKELVIPVIEESVLIDKKKVESGSIIVTKHVEERIESIDISLASDEYIIEHVPVNSYVDNDMPKARQEGDTLILPLVKEVMVKRLLLVEEVRITKRTTQRTEQQMVTLRKESVTVERNDSNL